MVDFSDKDETIALLSRLVLALASRGTYIETGENSVDLDAAELAHVEGTDLVVQVSGNFVRLRGVPRDGALARFPGGVA